MTISAATVVQLILAFVKLANAAFGWLHDRQLITAAQDAMIAKELATMAERSTTLKQVSERFAKMTPEQVLRELEGNHDLRD